MYMSENEIAKSYRRAVHKKTQIRILSELNGCSKYEIKKILIKTGDLKEASAKKGSEIGS